MKAQEYLVKERLPLFWCAGCGNGSILHAILRCFEKLNFTKENTVVVTGIGCWGKADDYINTNTFHGTHGRALAFGTGIKLANPELNVVVLMGDGDGATIGGNHLIHTARRNVDVTVILVNNLNYGMTGGQYSGTTPCYAKTSTSRYGHIENGFDLSGLMAAAGAPYVARGTTYGIAQLERFILEALQKKGFSFVEAISQCPTHFGKLNGMKEPASMLYWIKEKSISIKAAEKLSEIELEGKFITGKFVDKEKEDYSTKYSRVIRNSKKVKGGK